VAWLDGIDTPYLEQQQGFTIDGAAFKGVLIPLLASAPGTLADLISWLARDSIDTGVSTYSGPYPELRHRYLRGATG
jgi:hypothetical protein